MEDLIEVKWKRSESAKFPQIWRTFRAKDVDSDNIVEYRIQDLPEDRFDEAINLMRDCFMKDEPMCEAYDLINDADALEDFTILWASLIRQKVSLVCFKEGSDEIVGLNMNIVMEGDDKFMENNYDRLKSGQTRVMFDVLLLLYKNFDTKKHYQVDSYLTSFGLVVNGKYRGRGIGEHFLRARQPFCEAFGIKLSSTIFSSNFSNKIADNAGFEVNVKMRYEDIRRNFPECTVPPIRSNDLTIKSIQY